MTKEEVVKLLMVIQSAYPNYKVPDKEITVNTWLMMLKEYDAKLIMASLKTFIATDKSGFAPSIGQVINCANTILESSEKTLTPAEAWGLVSKALRNGAYNSQAEFEKLPEDVQKAVGGHEMIKVWAMDSNYNESVVSSNFMRNYQTVLNRKSEMRRMPQSVKDLIGTSVLSNLLETRG